MPLLSHVSQDGGGNNNLSSDDFKCRKYVITINNYTLSQLTQLSKLAVESTKYIYGEELGEQGTPHIQGYFEFKNQMRRATLKNKIGGDFWCDRAKGSVEKNWDYCSKDGKYITNLEDLFWKQEIKNFYKWELDIIDILKGEPSDRYLYWFWEPEGCAGKTTFQKWLFQNEKRCVTLSGKASDMKNAIVKYKEINDFLPKTILINIPRSVEHLSYTGIEEIKDMYFFSGKYEGGMVCGKCPHVIIFANEEPDKSKMSHDRWVINKLENENSSVNYDFYEY